MNDYKINPKLADELKGIICLPQPIRILALTRLSEIYGTKDFIKLFANFIGLANSVVENNREMIDILLIVEGITHPDRSEDKANLPTIFGALQGIGIAQGIDHDKVCEGCAFRLGTAANQSPITTIDASDCANDSTKFLCHMDLTKKGMPYKACAGYAQAVKNRDVEPAHALTGESLL